MASDVTIYHNQRCTKSRQTLELLRGHGIEPRIIEYLKTPLSAKEVRSLMRKVGGDPQALVRRQEKAFKEAGLTRESGADELARAIAEHPILLERPVVVKGDRAAIGRPPENVLSIL